MRCPVPGIAFFFLFRSSSLAALWRFDGLTRDVSRGTQRHASRVQMGTSQRYKIPVSDPIRGRRGLPPAPEDSAMTTFDSLSKVMKYLTLWLAVLILLIIVVVIIQNRSSLNVSIVTLMMRASFV